MCRYCPSQNLFSLAPCFAAGIVAYRLDKDATSKFRSGIWLILLLALVTLVVLGVLEKRFGEKQFWIVSAAAGFSVPYFKHASNRFLTRGVSLIARYSYGIYLLHFFCIWIAFEKLSAYPFALRMVAFVALLLILSTISYHLIEQPFIDLGKKVAQRFLRRFESHSLPIEGKRSGAPAGVDAGAAL